MPDITHIKITKQMRDELKIAAIRNRKTLQELVKEIFTNYLHKYHKRTPYNDEVKKENQKMKSCDYAGNFKKKTKRNSASAEVRQWAGAGELRNLLERSTSLSEKARDIIVNAVLNYVKA